MRMTVQAFRVVDVFVGSSCLAAVLLSCAPLAMSQLVENSRAAMVTSSVHLRCCILGVEPIVLEDDWSAE